MTSDQFVKMFLKAGDATIKQKDRFSELDRAGDADFGVNIAKGFELVGKKLTRPSPTASKALTYAGDIFSMDIGSTIGGLFGQALTAAGEKLEGKEDLGAKELSESLGAMLEAVMTSGGANVGDKTMVDALDPAYHAALASARANKSFFEALADATLAAEDGSRRTIDMVATKGRSSYLGERSKGREDPGAAFIAFFLKAMLESGKSGEDPGATSRQ